MNKLLVQYQKHLLQQFHSVAIVIGRWMRDKLFLRSMWALGTIVKFFYDYFLQTFLNKNLPKKFLLAASGEFRKEHGECCFCG